MTSAHSAGLSTSLLLASVQLELLAIAFWTVFGCLVICSSVVIFVYLRRMIANRSLSVLERQARFRLLVCIVTLMDCILMSGIFCWQLSLASFCLLGFWGLTFRIGRAEQRHGKVIIDERDREINRVASTAGFASFWVCLVAVWGVALAFFGANADVKMSIGVMGFFLLVGGMVLVQTISALVTLTMYWRDARGETN
ncbi:TPA: hypothetical protein DDW35_12505 [Candidatus Sumerlaeota bacterium]|nr:hypothetical protein [Candidatus Sumerlaeota bacterium]